MIKFNNFNSIQKYWENITLIKKIRVVSSLLLFLNFHSNSFLTISTLIFYIFLLDIKANKLSLGVKNIVLVNSVLGPINKTQFIRDLFYKTKNFQDFSFRNKIVVDMVLHIIPSVYLILKKKSKINTKDKIINTVFTDLFCFSYIFFCYSDCPKINKVMKLYDLNMSEFKVLFLIHNISIKILHILLD